MVIFGFTRGGKEMFEKIKIHIVNKLISEYKKEQESKPENKNKKLYINVSKKI